MNKKEIIDCLANDKLVDYLSEYQLEYIVNFVILNYKDNMDKKEQIENLWKKWTDFKETAEQHMFVSILMVDTKLTGAYNDLMNNWDENHADIFIKAMNNILNKYGVK